ncbi:MAG: hypothetical protein M3Z85_18375, partial [Acidobacteriota bacterium]|nr:hypothetical protein [Acidobacteriota bacterium]
MMTQTSLVTEIEEGLQSFPWFDPHTHLDASHLTARGLDDVVLYHMSISDLYSAGCPSGARLNEDRSPDEARHRLKEAIPYLAKTRNTFIAWGSRVILADLYGWHEPLTDRNWERLHAAIAERAERAEVGDWARTLYRKSGFARTATEMWRGRDGRANDLLQYVLEWGFFARAQWGQPDIPLYELERTWDAREPGVPIPVTFDRQGAAPLPRKLRSVDDVREAVSHYC